MKTSIKRTIATGALLASGVASAGSVTYSGSIARMTTDWTTNFQAPLFDDQGGALTLTDVMIEMTGTIFVDALAENRGPAPEVVTLTINGQMSISRGADTMVTVSPSLTESFLTNPYDFKLDFNGPSGVMLNGLVDSATALSQRQASMTGGLGSWIGTGMTTLTASATAQTSQSGGGNLSTLFRTEAGLTYNITYSFVGQIVPLPGAASLGVMGLATLGSRRRRRSC